MGLLKLFWDAMMFLVLLIGDWSLLDDAIGDLPFRNGDFVSDMFSVPLLDLSSF